MRRTPLLALLLLTGFGPADAFAESACPEGAACRTVTVPLDRTGNVAGTLRLRVAALPPRRGGSRAPVLVLSGGPGQANVSSLSGWVADLGRTVVRERGVIAFDPRGTGRSGALVCPEMQRSSVPRDTAAAQRCAERLGEARRFYTTLDQAEDVEAVRAALGVEKLALYGISYGTKVAQVYARLHPDRVESLALDSIVPAEGSSALSQEILGAMPRLLGRRMPAVADLVDRVRTAPAVGVAIGARGNRHRTTAFPAAIFDVLLAGDFNPVLRQALPAAITAVEAGDPAPLMRLVHAARESERQPASPRAFSAGLYAATSCEELAFPWAPNASFSERARQALAAARQSAALGPFAAEDVLTLDWIALCLRWPLTPGPRPLPPVTAEVPALLLNGGADLRTPLEDALRVLEQLPKGRLLSVPGVGHSVVGGDPSGCARRALRAFLRARAITGDCPRARTGYERGVPVPPRSLAAVRGRGKAGRTLAAVGLTLEDAVLALHLSPTGERAGGLRRGTVRFTRGPLMRLRGYEYVPGVRITTRGRRIAVTGPAAARGTLTLRRGGRLTGRLGGQAIDVELN